MGEKDSVTDVKAVADILIGLAQVAHGHIYYETKLKRMQRKDGSWKVRIDVYEKYRRPNRKSVALLKKYGVETCMHRRS